jgi:CHAD domain-containing protein
MADIVQWVVAEPMPLLAQALSRRIDALADHLSDAIGGDVRAVHHARVATRRLREVMPVVVAVGGGRKPRRKRSLRRLTRALGPVRELDVALGLLDARAEGQPAAGVVAVRAHIVEARAAALDHLQATIDPGRAKRLLVRLAAALSAIEERGDGLPRRARRVLGGRVVDRAKALADAVSASGSLLIIERVHDVRVAVKRLRYALELIGELRVVRTASLVSSLRVAQDVLGSLHDLDVLRHRITRVLREVPPDSIVARELDALTQAIDADVRLLHARYLRAAAGLVRLTDRVHDRVAPCLDRSISTSFVTPSPKSAAPPGPTTRSVRSPTKARRSGAGRPPGSSRSARGRTSS